MNEKMADILKLENGLTLEFYDRSRRMAGDRWLVSFEARMDVPVTSEYLENRSPEHPSFDAVREAVGEKVVYRYEKSRNFIQEREKDRILQGLKDRFLQTTLGYFSSGNFPRNIILARYREVQGGSKTWTRQ